MGKWRWGLATLTVLVATWGIWMATYLPREWIGWLILILVVLALPAGLLIIRAPLYGGALLILFAVGAYAIALSTLSVTAYAWPPVVLLVCGLLALLLGAELKWSELVRGSPTEWTNLAGGATWKRIAASAGIVGAAIPLASTWFSAVYQPSTVPPDLELSTTFERGGTKGDFDPITGRVTLRNTSRAQVHLLASVLNVDGVRLENPPRDLPDDSYATQVANIAATPAGYVAVRHAGWLDEGITSVYAETPFLDTVLESGGDRTYSLIFYVPHDRYDFLRATTSISYSRESSVVRNVVSVHYSADSSTLGDNASHTTLGFGETVDRIRGPDDLSSATDFQWLRVGGSTTIFTLALWGTPMPSPTSPPVPTPTPAPS